MRSKCTTTVDAPGFTGIERGKFFGVDLIQGLLVALVGIVGTVAHFTSSKYFESSTSSPLCDTRITAPNGYPGADDVTMLHTDLPQLHLAHRCLPLMMSAVPVIRIGVLSLCCRVAVRCE